jgi:hypothetical protein
MRHKRDHSFVEEEPHKDGEAQEYDFYYPSNSGAKCGVEVAGIWSLIGFLEVEKFWSR